MYARRLRAEVDQSGQLILPDRVTLPTGPVELIVLYEAAPTEPRDADAEPLHPAFGIWSDRAEAADPAAFARALRTAAAERPVASEP
ncbi:MAG: hypothetical protein IT204_07840 [Fimbriimonadaceae bacterium]|nr:hypothetical protein [Fimbriimonadaceae bacterium]